jgi:hypothetical protein
MHRRYSILLLISCVLGVAEPPVVLDELGSLDQVRETFSLDALLPGAVEVSIGRRDLGEGESVVINEFVAKNGSGLWDEDGDLSDWIELHNRGDEAMSLEGWTLTDDEDDPDKWVFPDITIPAYGYLVIFASGKDRRPAFDAPLHTSFRLRVEGEYLALMDADGLVVDALWPEYPPQARDSSYGRFGSGDVWRFFDTPTPGEENAEGGSYEGFTEVTGFSREGGPFAEAFFLELTAYPPDAAIHFTLDGTIPDEASPTYNGPFVIAETACVQVRAFAPGFLPGGVADQTYLALDESVWDFDSNLAIVVIDTHASSISEDAYETVLAAFVDTDDGGRAAIAGTPDFSGVGGLKIRGSSSTWFPKKSYAFETWDLDGEDLDISLLGLPAESDWILYAPYSDKTLMRNYLAYLWSNRMGRYAVRTRFVEMFLTEGGKPVHAEDYVGVYVLMEKIKRGPDRVDIAGLDPSDNAEAEITGGYIIKHDRLDPGDDGFYTDSGVQLAYVEPKEEEITPEQAAWLLGYLNDFEDVLHGPDFADPVEGYARYIDAGSFIDNHLMVELTRNIDGYRLSHFMFKDRWGRLNVGPIWDYNRSLGNANYRDGWKPDGWYCDGVLDLNYPWYRDLFEDPEFDRQWRDRWRELRQNAFATHRLFRDIDDAAALLKEATERNFARWEILGESVWPNFYVGQTYEQEVMWMKWWLGVRLAWMDQQIAEGGPGEKPSTSLGCGDSASAAPILKSDARLAIFLFAILALGAAAISVARGSTARKPGKA